MNKSAACITVLCTAMTPSSVHAAVLQCTSIHGSGQPTVLQMQYDGRWANSDSPYFDSCLYLERIDGDVQHVPTSDWASESYFTAEYYDATTDTVFRTQPSLNIKPDAVCIDLAEVRPGEFSEPVSILTPIRISPSVTKGEQLRWRWQINPLKHVLGDSTPFITTSARTWSHDAVIELGENPLGQPATYTFAANPAPTTSSLKLDFVLESGHPGASGYSINGVPRGGAPTPGVDANTGPVTLGIEPSGVPGDFRGTVTATLDCI